MKPTPDSSSGADMKQTGCSQHWMRRSFLTAFTLLLLACGIGENDSENVLAAKEYLAQDQIREAALELRNALQKNPENAEARFLLGQIQLDVGDIASAEKEFRRAAEFAWNAEEVNLALARTLLLQQKYNELLKMIEAGPDWSSSGQADTLALRAAAEAGLGNLEEARRIIDKGSQIKADSLEVLKTQARLQLVGGQVNAALETLRDAIQKYPKDSELLLLSATASVEAQNMVSAKKMLKQVIELDSPKTITLYGRQARIIAAKLYILEKDYARTHVLLDPLLRRDSADLEANYLYGLLAYHEKAYDVAEIHLRKILKRVPSHAPTILLFGTLSYAKGDFEQAARYLNQYISAQPDNIDARKLLGRTYMVLGQHDQAQRALQPGLSGGMAEDAELLALIGLSQLQGGDALSGIKGLEQAVRTAPESAALKGELAKAYISAGQIDSAIDLLNKSLAEGGTQLQTQALLVTAHLRAKAFDEATDTVMDMLAKQPDDPAVLTLTGSVFAASGETIEAHDYFEKAMLIDPDFIPAIMAMARLEEVQGHLDEAMALYEGIANPQSGTIEPHIALARIAENQGDDQRMLEWLEKARSQAVEDTKSRRILAEYYLRNDQPKKAESYVNEAIKIAPQDNGLVALHSRTLMAQGQYNKAVAQLNELVNRAPESAYARVLLGEGYLQLGQIKDARYQLGIALQKEPGNISALAMIVAIELHSGQNQQALDHARQIQESRPELYLGYELAGDVLINNDEFNKAKTAYEQAWQRRQSVELAIKLSETSARLGQREDVTRPLLAWLSTHPDDTRGLQYLGTAYQNLEENAKAIEIYEKTLAMEPDNVVVLNNLAWLYAKKNDDRAIVLAERAYSAYPDNAGIQDTYGWILVQHGQIDKGRQILEKALEQLSDVAEVRYHYARALYASGEKIEARKILKKLLADGAPFDGREDAEKLLSGK